MSPRISRHTRRVELPGLHVYQWDSLAPLLARNLCPPALLVSDLSQGAWQPRQVAHELAQQVACPLPVVASPAQNDNRPAAYGDLVGRGIDAEATGEKATINATDALAHLAPALAALPPHTILILLPADPRLLGADNVTFIYLLAQWLAEATPHQLWLVSVGEAATQPVDAPWTVCYDHTVPARIPAAATPLAGTLAAWPGLLPPAQAQMLRAGSQRPAAWVALRAGYWLLKPDYRPAAFAQQPTPAEAFPSQPLYTRWQFTYQPDASLMGQAWQLFQAGSADIGLRLATRCVDTAPLPIMRAVLLMQLQGMRIATMRFADAAAEAPPAPDLPDGLRSFLHQAIGWGMAMTNQLAEASQQFEQAIATQEAGIAPLEKAYFDNIHAFLRYRTGDTAGAFALEKNIEALHATVADEDFRLTYINAINQARLYRSVGDLAQADAYYERAFATTEGNRSESDLVYTHACRGLLYADQQRTAESFAQWLQSALHWAAAVYPEAIGGRTLTAILNTQRLPPRPDWIETTAEAFCQRLEQLSRTLAIDYRIDPARPACTFVAASHLAAPPEVLLANRYLLIGTTAQPEAPAVTGPASDRLRALLTALLSTLVDLPRTCPTIVVDDRGIDAPLSPAALWLAGWQWQARRLQWCGADLPADPSLVRHLRFDTAPAIARQVTTPTGQQVHYKRYLAPLPLTDKAVQWLTLFRQAPSLGHLWQQHDPATLTELLRLFQQRRLIRPVAFADGQLPANLITEPALAYL